MDLTSFEMKCEPKEKPLGSTWSVKWWHCSRASSPMTIGSCLLQLRDCTDLPKQCDWRRRDQLSCCWQSDLWHGGMYVSTWLEQKGMHGIPCIFQLFRKTFRKIVMILNLSWGREPSGLSDFCWSVHDHYCAVLICYEESRCLSPLWDEIFSILKSKIFCFRKTVVLLPLLIRLSSLTILLKMPKTCEDLLLQGRECCTPKSRVQQECFSSAYLPPGSAHWNGFPSYRYQSGAAVRG